MENIGLASDTEENIEIIMQKASFWAGILGVKGKCAHIITSSPSYVKVRTAFQDLIRCLETGRLSAKSINKLSQSKAELRDLCESGIITINELWSLVQHCFCEKKRIFDVVQLCWDYFLKIKDKYLQNGHQKACELLGSCIEQLRLAEENFDSNITHFNVYKRSVADILGTQDASMPEGWNKLFDVIESRVFWNLEFRNISSYSFKTASELITLLAKEGLARFETLWMKRTVTLREAHKTFPKGTDIDREFELAKATLPTERQLRFPVSHLRLVSNIDTDDQFIRRLQEVLQVFSLSDMDQDFSEAVDVMEGLSAEADDMLDKDISTLGQKLQYLDDLNNHFDHELASGHLDALSTSEHLIAFLKPILKQDITYLVDAVEEFVEQVVTDQAVSCLITVKEFVQRLLDTDIQSVSQFLEKLSSACESVDADDIATCNKNLSGLKALYHGLSDKEAMAKQTIQKILRQGVVHYKQVRKQSVVCEVHVTFVEREAEAKDNEVPNDEEGQTSKINLHRLQDLRSQALFISSYNKPSRSEKRNSEKARRNKDEKNTKANMMQFVKTTDQIMRITHLIDHLQELGHFEYGSEDRQVSLKDLPEEENELENKRQVWEESLEKYRKKYVWLNYIYGDQLQKMEVFLRTKKNANDIDAILKYIHPDVSMHISRIEPNINPTPTTNSVLDDIGRYLCSLFDNHTPVRRRFKIKQTSKKLQDTIMKGRLAIVKIGKEHKVLSKTILALYLNTTGTLPESHQLIICDHTTQWNEVSLLLKRCMIAGLENKDAVYCIAGAETLTSDMKLKLASEIKELEESTSGNFRLGLIFKGSIHEAFLHFFRDYVVNVDEIATLTDSEMSDCLRLHCKGVRVVKSEIPGLGKTEWIKRLAIENHLKVMTFHASGTFTKRTLIQEMGRLHLSSDALLHIDVGEMDLNHAHLLDNFIFEMMILRVVTSGTISCTLNTTNICIEIPNSFQDRMRFNLPTLTHFEITQLHHRAFLDRFIASQDNMSSIQIVCRYLEQYDSGTLDTIDGTLSLRKGTQYLPSEKCKSLLKKYFIASKTVSYTHINTFVRILAEQLKKFSQSTFVRHSGILVAADSRKSVTIRRSLTKALIDRAKEISTLSEGNSKAMQVDAMTKQENATTLSDERNTAMNVASSAETENAAAVNYMAERDKSIIRWENGINLMIVFNFDKHSITPLYRNLQDVPLEIREFFRNQMQHELPQSIYALSPSENNLVGFQDGLHKKLQRIVSAKRNAVGKDVDKKYILTPDNMLKIVLIYQRLQANLPVVIVGETGCGKTSLIRYLADVTETEKIVYNIHAGLSREDICSKIKSVNENARKKMDRQVWLFLDEINTSEHIGILSDAICHGRILNEILVPNIRIIAACNPYRLRSPNNILTEGLDSKIRQHCDEMSRLVYRVHPLPETMMNHVWDFGVVSDTDEKVYIGRMLENALQDTSIPGEQRKRITHYQKQILADLLSASQREIRRYEKEEFSVSLRDIDRCTRLFRFFVDFLEKKRPPGTDLILDAMILTLAHCYYYRLKDARYRKRYRECLAKIIEDAHLGENITERYITDVVNKEQKDLLDRMTLLPEFTAKNSALKENVFVLLVSILTRIPIFLIGHPGCSKSLSIQLIRRHLRGKNSENELFKKLPHVIFFSYQGSESSTSRGIEKVFERATQYQRKNNEDDVRAVVLLDEVGLAEISPNNPLKVLHNLLEPDGKRMPEVGVIGISNWALDAAKMNRAVHLSRPLMTLEELKDTATQIGQGPAVKNPIPPDMIDAIATAYYKYVPIQPLKNFHGLRDIYALIKYLTWRSGDFVEEDFMHGLVRNFGGDQKSMTKVKSIFMQQVSEEKQGSARTFEMPTLKIIDESLKDRQSRHLMFISHADVGVIEMKQILVRQRRSFEIMYGSQFPQDASEEFDNHSLSRVILCMEKGKVLILKDFPSIYGSLYDMLNRNYMVIKEDDNQGKQEKQYCRIAYGPYSNPMCIVHESFKCVVVVNDTDVAKMDPPFLNRFEKQFISVNDLVTEEHSRMARDINTTLQQLLPKDNDATHINKIIPYLTDNAVLSLVLRASKSEKLKGASEAEMRNMCLRSLLCVAKPEAVLCFDVSPLYTSSEGREVVNMLVDFYNRQPLHRGIYGFLTNVDQMRKFEHTTANTCVQSDSVGLYIVLTHSNIHSSLELRNDERSKKSRIIIVADIESLNELSGILEDFYKTEKYEQIFIHFDALEDLLHLDIAKNAIETYLYKSKKSRRGKEKRCFLILHLDRNNEVELDINFSSEWAFLYLDSVCEWKDTVSDLCQMPLLDVLRNHKDGLKVFMQKELSWAFTRIQYEPGCERSLVQIQDYIKHLSSDEVLEYMFDIVLRTVKQVEASVTWIKEIAQNENELLEASSFIGAIQSRLNDTVKYPMAKLIYRLDELGALDILCNPDEDRHKREYLLRVLSEEGLFSLDKLETPVGPGCYVIKDVRQRALPISDAISEAVSKTIDSNCVSFDDYEQQDSVLMLSTLLQNDLAVFVESAYHGIDHDYLLDFCDSCTVQHQNSFTKNERLFIWLWTARYSEHSTDTLIRKYLENEIRILEYPEKSLSHDEHVTSDVEIHLLIAFLYVHHNQCKEVVDGFFRMMSLLKNNLSINIVDILKSEKEIPKISSPMEALGHILKRVCKDLTTNPLWLRNVRPTVWHRTCMSLFSIAKVIFDDTEDMELEEFHILRFCCDFVALVLIPLELPITDLFKLGSVLDTITSTETYNAFIELLGAIRRNHKALSCETYNYVQTLYVYRCLAYSSKATTVLEVYLSDIERERLKPRFLKHVIYAGIASKLYSLEDSKNTNESENSDRLLQYIDLPDADLQEDEFVTFMDVVVEKLLQSLDIACIVDVLEKEFKDSLNYGKIKLDSVDKAVKLSQSPSVTFLQLLSIAYLRVAVELIVVGIKDKESQHNVQNVIQRLFNSNSITKYFWRFAYHNAVLERDLQVTISNPMEYRMDKIDTYDLYKKRISLCCSEEYEGVVERWNDLLEDKEHADFIDKASLGLCGVFHSTIYLKQKTSSVAKEKEMAANIIEGDKAMIDDQKVFLRCLACLEDFRGACMRGSENVFETCLSEFLIQLGGMVLFSNSFKSNSLFYKLITMPNTILFGSLIPGQSRVPLERKFCVSCECGNRTIVLKKTDKCSMCEKELNCKCEESTDRPEELGRCSTCNGYKIPSHDSPTVSKLGIPFEIEASENIQFFACSNGNLNSLSFRVLELLVFGCLTIKDSLGTDIKSLNGDVILSSEILGTKMKTHWNTLRHQLSLCDFDLLLCLQAFLLKSKDDIGKVQVFRENQDDKLHTWEHEFSKTCNKFFGRRKTEISSMLMEYNAHMKIDKNNTTYHVREKAIANDSDFDLYRIVAVPTAENLLCQLEISEKQYLFLQLTLRYEPMLHLPRFLPHFLRWFHITTKYNRYRMIRSERTTMSVTDLIQKLPERKMMQDEFQNIQKYWNNLPSLLERLKHLGFNVPNFELQALRDETKVEQCMVTDEESTLQSIIFYLAQAQNEFIDEVLKLDTDATSSASSFLKGEHGRSFICRVSIHRLRSGEVLNFKLSDYLNLSQALPFTGQGDVILYDFWKIETDTVVGLLEGKAYIDLPPHLYQIQFKDDLFSNSAMLLRNIRSLIPQRPLEDSVEKELREKTSETPTLAGDLLSAIGILLTVACRSTEKHTTTIVEFMDKWKELHNLRDYRGISVLADRSLTLCNIVPFYLTIESIIGERTVRQLTTNTHLDTKMTTEVKSLLAKDRLINRNLKDSICVFASRSLSVENPDLDKDSRLIAHLDNKAYWNVEKVANIHQILEGIPKEIKLVHIKALYEVLQENSPSISSARSKTANGTGRKPGRKKPKLH